MGFDESSLLYAEPSFFRGMGRALDLGATRNVYNDSPTPAVADRRALCSDWAAVGRDMVSTMDRFGRGGANVQ